MYSSTLKKFRENRTKIEKNGDWISQADLAAITGVTIKTIRALRSSGAVYSETVRQNDVWISVDSVKAYCDRR